MTTSNAGRPHLFKFTAIVHVVNVCFSFIVIGSNSEDNGSTCACDHAMTITVAAVFNVITVFIAVVVITALIIR